MKIKRPLDSKFTREREIETEREKKKSERERQAEQELIYKSINESHIPIIRQQSVVAPRG